VRSPTAALLWQIWRRNTQAVWALVVITIVGWFADVVARGGRSEQRIGGPGPLNELLAMLSFLLLIGIFSYTESSGDKGIGRFPHRLFTLPVSALRLVAVPVIAGIVAIVLLYLAWMGRLTTGGTTSPFFVAVLLAAFMVFYQTTLWTLTRFGALRLVVLGAIGVALFAIGIVPASVGGEPSPWRTERFLGGAVAGAAIASFLFAWSRVARLRSGGEGGPRRLDSLVALVVDLVPGRLRPFASPAGAYFWYEWRSGGALLPALVGGVLLVIVAPFTLLSRDVAGNGMGFLLAVLMTPVVLAAPVGLAFSKPLFWSEELSVPPFIAVRPLSAADVVAVKLTVAALATVMSWLVVFAFLVVWLSLWGNVEGLGQIAIQLWAFHDHSVLAVYGIAALLAAAGMFLTWRFLTAGLWAGLSGNRRLYFGSVMAGVVFVIACLVFGADRLPGWVLDDPTRMAPFVWGAAIAVIAKYWLAARTWRGAQPRLVLRYLAVWLVGTASFVALGMVFWRIVRIYVAMDSFRLQSLLILLALLAMPLARVGLAPALLERNRHRE
jgi:hypothetical protein